MMRKGRPIPGVDTANWWQKKWIVEFAAAFIALFLLGFTGYRQLKDNSDDLFLWVLLTALAFFTTGIGFLRTAQAYSDDKKNGRGAEHDGLLGTMVTIHAMASDIINRNRSADQHADLRVTFHRLAPNPNQPTHLEQVIPYVADDGINGEVGRKFSVNVGITGQAVRTKEPYSMASSASTNEEHVNILVEEWGYLRWQAERLTPGRYSAVAAPVLADLRQRRRVFITKNPVAQVVIGVIYLDSNTPDAFDDVDTQERLMVLFDAVADYVTWRY